MLAAGWVVAHTAAGGMRSIPLTVLMQCAAMLQHSSRSTQDSQRQRRTTISLQRDAAPATCRRTHCCHLAPAAVRASYAPPCPSAPSPWQPAMHGARARRARTVERAARATRARAQIATDGRARAPPS
jgi:hypothetical protein